MTLLTLSQAQFHRGEHWTLSIEHLSLQQGETIAFVGTNGSGKSSLAQALTGELTCASGQCISQFQRPVRLSFEQLSQFINQEWQRNNSDLFSEDENSDGLLTYEVIQNQYQNSELCERLAGRFAISALLHRPFKVLSTGETRKVLLCQALMAQPDLLVLDEPFDGLDIDSRQALQSLLAELAAEGLTLALVLNRFEDIPPFIQYVGILAEAKLQQIGDRATLLSNNIVSQLQHLERIKHLALPAAENPSNQTKLPDQQPLISLKQGRVSWEDNVIIQGLDWQVNPGEHWQITGPNGAGKSTLLSLVTGEHPQGYSNDLTLFGRRRGSGETLWDIKKHIGYVSSSLHLDYRVSASVRTVILSGFFDSIGLYQQPSDRQLALSDQWLALLGIAQSQANTPFHDLSWGQQRLILIVRALVKHPTLLILDEPLQGLDALNRLLVKQFISQLISQGQTQLLFVSHHAEDAPSCITHRLSFVKNQDNYYDYLQTSLT